MKLELEKTCGTCGSSGRHRIWAGDYWETMEGMCETCNGTGYVIADDGKDLVNFLRHQVIRDPSFMSELISPITSNG